MYSISEKDIKDEIGNNFDLNYFYESSYLEDQEEEINEETEEIIEKIIKDV